MSLDENCKLSEPYKGYDKDIRVCTDKEKCEYQHEFAGEVFCSLAWSYKPVGKLHPDNHYEYET